MLLSPFLIGLKWLVSFTTWCKVKELCEELSTESSERGKWRERRHTGTNWWTGLGFLNTVGWISLVEICNYKLMTGLHIPSVCGLISVFVCPPDTQKWCQAPPIGDQRYFNTSVRGETVPPHWTSTSTTQNMNDYDDFCSIIGDGLSVLFNNSNLYTKACGFSVQYFLYCTALSLIVLLSDYIILYIFQHDKLMPSNTCNKSCLHES